MNRLRFLLPVLSGALAALVVACAPAAKRERPVAAAAPSAVAEQVGPDWKELTQLELTYRSDTEAVRRLVEFGADGVIRVSVREATTSNVAAGELLLLGGQFLFTRGLNVEPGTELDVLDDAMLRQQLAVNLLREVAPEGPGGVSVLRRVSADDRGDPIGGETTNTSRYYYPPWRARGSLRPVNADTIGFELEFTSLPHADARKAQRVELHGEWKRASATPVFGDDFVLDGWRAFRLRVGTRQAADISVAAYVATPESRRYRTLGEARMLLRRAR